MDNAFWGSSQHSEGQAARPLTCANCGELLPMSGEAVLTCTVCGQGHRSLAPPPPSAEMRFQVGDKVAVLWGAHWWSAHVVEVTGEHSRRVHYEGWAPNLDEVVENRRIRAIDYDPGPSIVPPRIDESELKVKRANWFSAAGIVLVFAAGVGFLLFWAFGDQVFNPKSNPSAVETAGVGAVFDRVPGKALSPDVPVQKGGAFFVKWGDGWYPAEVLEVLGPDEFLVQYDGWSVDHNEIVSRDRLRILR